MNERRRAMMGSDTHIKPPVDYSTKYFTIVSLADNNTITFQTPDGTFEMTLIVSTDGGTNWRRKTTSQYDTHNYGTCTLGVLSRNQKLLIKGSNLFNGKFLSSENINVEGNIMSLCYGTDFVGQTTLNGRFKELFYRQKVISAKNLILPSTILSVENCYDSMFRGCNSLTEAPELPATTLTQNCYRFMFQGCALSTAPTLPATTLVKNCYYYMFSSCTNLSYIKAMFTTKPGNTYTMNWVSGVSSVGTFVKNSAATWNVSGASGVPSGWTVEYADE